MLNPLVLVRERDTLVARMGTLALLLVAAAVGLAPDRAAVGQEIVVDGPVGRAVTLEPLDTAAAPTGLGTIGADGRLRIDVPQLPAGSYRVVIAGEGEAPVLEVVPLSQETSLLLLGVGGLLVLGLIAAGWILHRRWRDAIS
jgi:hypothetical protein